MPTRVLLLHIQKACLAAVQVLSFAWLAVLTEYYLFTVQVASTLEKMLAAPALLVPFGQASDNCHLANERLQRINLVKGKNVIKHLLNEVGTV